VANRLQVVLCTQLCTVQLKIVIVEIHSHFANTHRDKFKWGQTATNLDVNEIETGGSMTPVHADKRAHTEIN